MNSYKLVYPPYSVVIPLIDVVMLVIPMNTNGIIKYPTNITTIGAKPIPFPIIPFLDINLSFDSLLRAWY